MIQNSASADASELDPSRHPGNSYANVDPSAMSSAPVPPPGMCIPTNYVNVAPPCVTGFPEPPQGHPAEQRHAESGQVSEASKSKETPGEVEEDKVVDGQGQSANQPSSSNEYVETGSVNELGDADVPDGCRMPDYMNVDIPQDLKVGKKLPAPPVPPRGKIPWFSESESASERICIKERSGTRKSLKEAAP